MLYKNSTKNPKIPFISFQLSKRFSNPTDFLYHCRMKIPLTPGSSLMAYLWRPLALYIYSNEIIIQSGVKQYKLHWNQTPKSLEIVTGPSQASLQPMNRPPACKSEAIALPLDCPLGPCPIAWIMRNAPWTLLNVQCMDRPHAPWSLGHASAYICMLGSSLVYF